MWISRRFSRFRRELGLRLLASARMIDCCSMLDWSLLLFGLELCLEVIAGEIGFD